AAGVALGWVEVRGLLSRAGGADVVLRGRVVGAVPEAQVRGDRDREQDPEDDDDDEQLDQGEAALVTREALPQGADHAVGLLPGSVGGARLDRPPAKRAGAPNEGSEPAANRSSRA